MEYIKQVLGFVFSNGLSEITNMLFVIFSNLLINVYIACSYVEVRYNSCHIEFIFKKINNIDVFTIIYVYYLYKNDIILLDDYYQKIL